jgi:hypothetical protein
MIQKFFPLDKNYILKKVQADTKSHLLNWLSEEVKNIYLFKYNPLGIEDDIILKIKRANHYNLESLTNFYLELSGIYRYN